MIVLQKKIARRARGGPKSIRKALQSALQLEHAVIPPYLYALYSLKPGHNCEIAELLRSIVLEEMSHMALVCNILNALNCTPVIDDPAFIPSYPGHLPGSVEGRLVVGLAPFSKDLVKNVFARIEEPEDHMGTAGSKATTIGQFYRQIRRRLRRLPEREFDGDPVLQLQTGFATLQVNRVGDRRSAAAAIDEIVDQGEGTKQTAFDEESDLAHYYRLVEIYFGKKLIVDIGERLPRSFNGLAPFCRGHRIEFDPQGVWPATTNPNRQLLARNQRTAKINQEFNCTYTRLLCLLQAVFSGAPDQLAVSNTLMRSLTDLALYLMATEIGPGVTAGPTFEYTP